MVATYLLLFYSFLQMDLMSSFGEELIREFNLSHVQFGLLASLYLYVDMLLIIPAGICLDRYGPKLTICSALISALLGLAVFVLYPAYITAIMWRCLSGVLGAVSVLGPIMLIAKTFKTRMMGRTIGGFGVVIMSAGIIAQTPLIWVIQSVGMREALLINILFGISVLIIILFKDGISHRKETNLQREFQVIKQVYLSKSNWIIACFASLINLPIFILGASWGNLYLKTEHHIVADDASTILSMIFVGNVAGALLLGYVSDFFRNRLFFMLVGSLIYAISLLVLVSGIHFDIKLFYLIVFFIGFATGAQTLSYARMIDLHCPSLYGKATSMISLCSVGFGAVMQVVCGYMDIHFVPSILMLCAVISVALMIFLNLTDQTNHGIVQVHE